MLDTVEFGWKIEGGLTDGLISDIARVCPEGLNGNLFGIGTEEARITRYTGNVERLGVIVANLDGSIVTGGSIIKRRQRLDGIDEKQLTNEYLLSSAHCNRALQDTVSEYLKKIPALRDQEFIMRRADICYQRPVKSSVELLKSMNGAIKRTRGGRDVHDNGRGVDNGIHMKGGVVSFRAYDKGMERRGRIDNNLRMEEQIRKRSVKMEAIFDAKQLIFNRDECRKQLNNRFVDVIYGSNKMDKIEELVMAKRYQEALFVNCPELLERMRDKEEVISRSAWYRMQRAVTGYRAECIPIDLRLPEEAWMFDEEWEDKEWEKVA